MSTQPVSLYGVVSQVETHSNSRAIRFEPATYSKLSEAMSDSQRLIVNAAKDAQKSDLGFVSQGTAMMIYSTSFGACQIMGFNLYGPAVAYKKSILQFLESEGDQQDAFGKFVKWRGLDSCTPDELASSPTVRVRFATVYNGSPLYADLLAQALQSLGFTIAR